MHQSLIGDRVTSVKRHLAMPTAALRLCVAFLALAASRASGQVLPVIPDSGARIRIWRHGASDWQYGAFVRMSGDSLVVIPRLCCGIDTMPMSAVRALAVSTGRERRVSRILGGATWGAAAGVVGGAVAARLIPCNGSELCGIGFLVIVPWTALGGAVIGGLLGSRKVDRWERIYPRDGAALMVVPKNGGRVGITLALRL
ncbi:MAG TPA: hypothetical protein VJ650_16920 [Gemmatimonadaceae bacterium]|nr:hypothetical protein [Gemmatimonadaceae bacterium]